MNEDRKTHWENIYAVKLPNEVSWTQPVPQTSLDLIHAANCNRDAAVIDVGGGDSKLVDFLLDEGYNDISVLDISQKAIDRAQARLGTRAAQVNWIVADINDFVPTRKYALWHDRAAFHFLTGENEINSYVKKVEGAVSDYLVMGTFSETGPLKCSGIEIRQYSQEQLQIRMKSAFDKIRCINVDHLTPFGTTQNFTFCSFRRLKQ